MTNSYDANQLTLAEMTDKESVIPILITIGISLSDVDRRGTRIRLRDRASRLRKSLTDCFSRWLRIFWSFQVVIGEVKESLPIIQLDGMTSFSNVVSHVAFDDCFADGRRRFGT